MSTLHSGRVLNWRASPDERVGTHKLRAMPRLQMPASVLPSRWSNAHLVPEILDQGSQGSCTGHGSATAIWAALVQSASALGYPTPPCPSPTWLYYMARALEGSINSDNGAYISDVFSGVAQYGFVSRDVLPYSSDVLSPPADRITELKRLAADQRLLTGVSRIESTGEQRKLEMQEASSKGYLIVFGAEVDQAFMSLQSGRYWPGCSRAIGGHCMAIESYDETGVGIVNSWGRSWASYGRGLATWGAVEEFRDMWIVAAVPQYSGTVDA